MERRWLNVRKFLLRRALPGFRMLPLPLASRMIAGIGRTEYRMYPRLQQGYQEAVTRAGEILGCTWDVPAVSLDLAGNQILWRTRDLLLDNLPDRRVEPMFEVSGREILDDALAWGAGVILLTSHFGAHLLPTHWLARHGYPIRFYMERPRHVSRLLERQFQADGPISQDRLFITRKGDPSGSAVSILRAARALNAGMILYVAGDVRWSGQSTQPARFLGKRYQFSSMWVNLAAMTGAAVVPVFCQMQPRGTYRLEFRPPYPIPPEAAEAAKDGQAAYWVQTYLSELEDQVRLHPSNSNEYFFWSEPDDEAA
ncbi:MAG: lysophospholipid acyltransferase family protein [Planctomycetaceae bacterium]|nr:lysophospholipid acyltransferase family protein [Planctomycetaceae bacterium]